MAFCDESLLTQHKIIVLEKRCIRRTKTKAIDSLFSRSTVFTGLDDIYPTQIVLLENIDKMSNASTCTFQQGLCDLGKQKRTKTSLFC